MNNRQSFFFYRFLAYFFGGKKDPFSLPFALKSRVFEPPPTISQSLLANADQMFTKLCSCSTLEMVRALLCQYEKSHISRHPEV